MSRWLGLTAEALRVAVSQPVATAVTTLIVAAACGVIVSTTGQTVAVEQSVLSQIDDAGTRTIVVEDTEGSAELTAGAVERVSALDGVDWAVGLGIATDVRPLGLDGTSGVPLRPLFGQLPSTVQATAWDQESATALAGQDALRLLGFATAAGPVEHATTKRQLGVVGWLNASPPLDFLNRSLLTPASGDDAVVRIIAVAASPERVLALKAAIASILDPADPASVVVRTSDALVEIRAAVQGEIGTFGRNIVAATLGAGLVLTSLNVFGAVTTRRRDFGRRRALGASRVDVALLVTIQTMVTAAVGAVVGGASGSLIVAAWLGVMPRVEFTVAVAILAVVTTTIAALPPAVVAAMRDPVRVLRVA